MFLLFALVVLLAALGHLQAAIIFLAISLYLTDRWVRGVNRAVNVIAARTAPRYTPPTGGDS